MGLLPRRTTRRARSVSPLPPPQPPAPGARPSLLVCDDNSSVTQLLDVMFSHEGWRVEVVTSGEACLDVLDRRLPDVVLLDQEMGGLTGLQTAATARKRGFDRPILLFSAYLDAAARNRADRLGVHAVSKVDFPAVVRHVTAARQSYLVQQQVPEQVPART